MAQFPKIGILGGGQLGRMLIQNGTNYNVEFHVLEKGSNFPCATLCHSSTNGSLMNFDDVYSFGQTVDVVTIEIEHVNSDALEKLEQEGKTVIPSSSALKIIQDKGLQKQFYLDNGIPTSVFALTSSKDDIASHKELLPAFHKLRKFGYDGKGVQKIDSIEEIDLAFEELGMLEQLVDIDKEISVIAVKNTNGEIKAFPPVELVFNPKYNLVDYLLSPARIEDSIAESAEVLALKVVDALNSPGIFAVEMFLTKSGELLVNETAPRTHNSGHQSIEGNISSQFEQQLRALLNVPLGSTAVIKPSAMVNLIGEPNYTGSAVYQGLDEILALEGVYVHLYGKAETRPGRKMGHITILGENYEEIISKVETVKQQLKVIA